MCCNKAHPAGEPALPPKEVGIKTVPFRINYLRFVASLFCWQCEYSVEKTVGTELSRTYVNQSLDAVQASFSVCAKDHDCVWIEMSLSLIRQGRVFRPNRNTHSAIP